MRVEVMTGILIGVGVFIATGLLTGLFILVFKKPINRIIKRVDQLTLCNLAIFDAFKEQGVNGRVKKRFEELEKQIVED